MKIHNLLQNYDQTVCQGVIALFDFKYFIKMCNFYILTWISPKFLFMTNKLFTLFDLKMSKILIE